jgi:hypothetical protein
MADGQPNPTKGVQGNPGQLGWQEDPAILARMQEGARLRSHGLTAPEIALKLGIARSMVYEDRNRLLKLRKEEAKDAVQHHIENLQQQAAEIRKALDSTDTRSLNVGQLRGLLRQIEMDCAKLDGSLVERKETKLDADGVTFTLNLTGS